VQELDEGQEPGQPGCAAYRRRDVVKRVSAMGEFILLAGAGFVKVFGCRPHTDRATGTGAGVRKPARDETASRTVGAVPQAQLWGFKEHPEPHRIAPQGSREVIGGREAVLMMRCGHQFGSGRVRMEHDCSTDTVFGRAKGALSRAAERRMALRDEDRRTCS